jgi:hypothetical protein
MMQDETSPTGPLSIDPAEFCRLLKLVDREPPRMSRDLEPDIIGIGMKQQILDVMLVAPPAPEQFAAVLLERAAALDFAPGAARGVCSDILLEWEMARSSPEFIPWLRREAENPRGPRRRRREDRDGEPAWRPRRERGFGLTPAEGDSGGR